MQAAWGRTGEHLFGIEHWNVTPDILTSAKGMGNGAPIGLTIATPEVADKYPGITFATFGGNPVSCAAAHATINIIEDDNLSKLRRRRQTPRRTLQQLKEKHQLVGDARGIGMMQALELVKDRKTKEPAPAATPPSSKRPKSRRADRQRRRLGQRHPHRPDAQRGKGAGGYTGRRDRCGIDGRRENMKNLTKRPRESGE